MQQGKAGHCWSPLLRTRARTVSLWGGEAWLLPLLLPLTLSSPCSSLQAPLLKTLRALLPRPFNRKFLTAAALSFFRP